MESTKENLSIFETGEFATAKKRQETPSSETARASLFENAWHFNDPIRLFINANTMFLSPVYSTRLANFESLVHEYSELVSELFMLS